MLLAGMFAGHHTSSVTTAWTLIELLRNREYLQARHREIDGVFGNGTPVSHAALRELTVTENAVKEALRLHPPLFMLVRVAKQDFTYKQWFVPEGHVDRHLADGVAPDGSRCSRTASAFEPDRFAPPREEDKRDFAYIAFGGGRHKCLGNAFAILQIKAILALLLGQYEFELARRRDRLRLPGPRRRAEGAVPREYRRRAQPSVTMNAAAELSKMASPESMQEAMAVHGVGAANGANGARQRQRRHRRQGAGEEAQDHARSRFVPGPCGVRRRSAGRLPHRRRRQGRAGHRRRRRSAAFDLRQGARSRAVLPDSHHQAPLRIEVIFPAATGAPRSRGDRRDPARAACRRGSPRSAATAPARCRCRWPWS